MRLLVFIFKSTVFLALVSAGKAQKHHLCGPMSLKKHWGVKKNLSWIRTLKSSPQMPGAWLTVLDVSAWQSTSGKIPVWSTASREGLEAVGGLLGLRFWVGFLFLSILFKWPLVILCCRQSNSVSVTDKHWWNIRRKSETDGHLVHPRTGSNKMVLVVWKFITEGPLLSQPFHSEFILTESSK